MPRNLRFWRNVALISAVHLAAIYGLVRWSHTSREASASSIVWLSGDPGLGAAAAPAVSTPLPKPMKVATPLPEATPVRKEEPEEDRPMLAAAKSEIELPTPKPSATATATPRPKPTTTPAVKVPPKPKPKHTPKPTPKPSPKPTPKRTIVAKASPTPPKAKRASEDDEKRQAEEAEQIKMAKAVLESAMVPAEGPTPEKATAAPSASGKGNARGGGHAGGGGGESQFGWYGSMLHDRFYSEWVQPGTELSAGAKVSALVKIRIEKDGRVSKFEIIRPSGDATVDESVMAVAQRVIQVEALPPGLGTGDHYDVRINFELNADQ